MIRPQNSVERVLRCAPAARSGVRAVPATPDSRWNPWPVAIIAFLAIAISGAAGFIVFCSFNSSELVSPDYYEQELRFQQSMERTERAQALSRPPLITYDSQARRIRLELPPEHSGPTTTGTITLYRPSSSGLDRSFPLNLDSRAVQEIDATALAEGLWKVKICWKADGLDYMTEQNIVAAGLQRSGG